MLHHVKDLSPEQRHAAEILLGHTVSEGQTVSIKSLDASRIIPSTLSPEARIEALKTLNECLAQTPAPAFTTEEEDAAVNEALRTTRPDYRPVN